MYNPKCGKVRKLRSCYPVEMFTVLKMPLLKKAAKPHMRAGCFFWCLLHLRYITMLHESNLVEESHVLIGY